MQGNRREKFVRRKMQGLNFGMDGWMNDDDPFLRAMTRNIATRSVAGRTTIPIRRRLPAARGSRGSHVLVAKIATRLHKANFDFVLEDIPGPSCHNIHLAP